ncbi:MAG: hypothetical protein PHY34_04775 [Patescibacteria group bacterium]|nr:hypothetical protein [Patescibacteria group bacterium]MDD5715617.1 hypothetical protein [Patescibacteria group bacterium]
MALGSQKLIYIVGDGTLPPALQAVLEWVFESKHPVVLCTPLEQYPMMREGGDPDLVIMTDVGYLPTVVKPSAPERFIVVCSEAEQAQARLVDGVTFVPSTSVFEAITSAIDRNFW